MGKCSQLNICLLQITASVIEANGVMHSADGETRELAVASLERLVADLQKVEKNTPRLVDCLPSDCSSFSTAGLCLILCSLGFAAWHVAAGSRGRNCSSFIRKVKSANIRQSENIDTHCEDLLRRDGSVFHYCHDRRTGRNMPLYVVNTMLCQAASNVCNAVHIVLV